MTFRSALLTSVLAAASLALSSCEPKPAATSAVDEEMRPHSEEVRELMWQMARSTETIHFILARATWPTRSEQNTIVLALVDIEKKAKELEKHADKTDHPIFGEKLEAFQRDAHSARLAAEMKPPNLFLAGKLIGSCNSCHEAGFASPNKSEISSGDELPDVGRALLSERMGRHSQYMKQLIWSVLFLVDDEVAEIAEEIADETKIAKPLPDYPDDLNAQFPKEFFDLQDELQVRAGALRAAAESGDDNAVAKAFGHMVETCVACHTKYLEPHEGMEN